MNKIAFILLASISAFPISSIAQEQPPVQQQQPMGAQPADGNGMLRVRLDDGSPISVSIDGRYFRNINPVLTVGNLPEGQHYLRIYTFRNGWGGRRAGGQLIFEGNVDVYQGQMTVFALNPFTGRTRMNTRNANPHAYYRPDYEDYAYGAPENDDRGYSQPNNGNTAPDGYGDDQPNVPPPPPGSYNNNDNNNGNYQDNGRNNEGYSNNNDGADNNQGNNNYNGNGGYRYGGNYNDGENNNVPPAISQTDQPTSVDQPFMNKLKAKVDAKITDTNKLKVLKDGLAKQTVSTAQVNAMMGWLNFESSRVDFAKWAYDMAVDKQNYPQLERQFSYRSSSNELDDYINSKR